MQGPAPGRDLRKVARTDDIGAYREKARAFPGSLLLFTGLFARRLHRPEPGGGISHFVAVDQRGMVGAKPNGVANARPFLAAHGFVIAPRPRPWRGRADMCRHADVGNRLGRFSARAVGPLRAPFKGARPPGARRYPILCALGKFVAVAHPIRIPRLSLPWAADAARSVPPDRPLGTGSAPGTRPRRPGIASRSFPPCFRSASAGST